MHGHVFELSAGRLCLDFANTREFLRTYAELVSWARQSGILSPPEAKSLVRRAGCDPAKAKRALARAHALREAVEELFSGRSARAKALEELQSWLPRAYEKPQVRPESGYQLVFRDDLATFEGLLSPVVRSAIGLLGGEELDRVRQCAADKCAWLFLDESKNRSRQWCDMAVCGNRAKARRFYARKRTARRGRGSRARRPAGEKR